MNRLKELYSGIIALASDYEVAIAGGDSNSWDNPLAISITVLGKCPHNSSWRRSEAQVGDAILVSGDFGGSLRGKQFDFTPRVEEAQWIRQRYDVHAATDVSDGLARDLCNILDESKCGAEIELNDIPVSDVAREWSKEEPVQPPLERALHDGEDFELVLCMPSDQAEALAAAPDAPCPFTVIGRITDGNRLVGIDINGQRTPVEPRGFEHRFEPHEWASWDWAAYT